MYGGWSGQNQPWASQKLSYYYRSMKTDITTTRGVQLTPFQVWVLGMVPAIVLCVMCWWGVPQLTNWWIDLLECGLKRKHPAEDGPGQHIESLGFRFFDPCFRSDVSSSRSWDVWKGIGLWPHWDPVWVPSKHSLEHDCWARQSWTADPAPACWSENRHFVGKNACAVIMEVVRPCHKRGFGCKKEDFSIFCSFFFCPKFPLWTPLLTELLKKEYEANAQT